MKLSNSLGSGCWRVWACGCGLAFLWLGPALAEPAQGPAGRAKPDAPRDQAADQEASEPLAPLVPAGKEGGTGKPADPAAKCSITFDWTMGGPPKTVIVGQSIQLSFVVRHQPDPDPGTMDATATLGIIKPNHWTLTGLLENPPLHGGGLDYTAVKVGTEHLTMTYGCTDVEGKTVATFEVLPADYEVTFELERDGKMTQPLPGGRGSGGYHVTMSGQGGFSIDPDGSGGGFINTIGTRSATCKWSTSATAHGKQANTKTEPVTGEGLISVNGKADADGNLTLSIGLGPITSTAKVSGTDFDGKAVDASSSAFAGGNVQSSFLKDLTFPKEGGTKEFSGPLTIPPLSRGKSLTITDKGKVTVKRTKK